MKTTMKKIAAWLLALLLVLQMLPAMAEEQKVVSGTQGPITSYRDKLDIIAVTSTITVGDTIQLATTDKYENISWKSDNEDIAKVDQTGKLEAVAPGQVKITASEGIYSDSITIRVVGKSSGEEGTGAGEKLVIIINGNKEKITYDGKEHKLSYTVYCSTEGFDENKLHLLSEDHLASGTECGVYTDGLTKDDFSYDGSEEVEFVITNGWLQIKPATISIYVNNAEKFEGEEDPVFTAEVVGLQGEDTVESLNLTYNVSEDGVITAVIPQDGIINGHYRVDTKKSMAGKLTIKENPAKYNGTYILGLTQVKNGGSALMTSEVRSDKRLTTVTYSEAETPGYILQPSKVSYWTFEMQASGNYYISSDGKYLNIKDAAVSMTGTPQEFIIEDAGNGKIAIKNEKGYRLNLKAENVTQGLQGSSWNTKDGLPPQANESFTLYRGISEGVRVEQDLYNMLTLTGTGNYYRLRKTKITALDASKIANPSTIKADAYEMEPYDFSNTVFYDENNEPYIYSDHVLTGDYVSYFTVKLVEVRKENFIHKDATWLNNEDGWLDGAEATYSDEEKNNNDTPGYHANYMATLHKGTIPSRSVSITSDWDGGLGYIGLKITLTAHVTGFREGKYTLQWEYSTDGQNWTKKEGATGDTFTYELNETTTNYSWRVVAYDVK